MKTSGWQESSKRGNRPIACIITSAALVSAMVPVAALGIGSSSNEALADSSITDTSGFAHMAETAPECVRECISGYLDGSINKETLTNALADLADEGRITRTQLNAYMELIANDDLDGLKACIEVETENSGDDETGSDNSQGDKGDQSNDASSETGKTEASGEDAEDSNDAEDGKDASKDDAGDKEADESEGSTDSSENLGDSDEPAADDPDEGNTEQDKPTDGVAPGTDNQGNAPASSSKAGKHPLSNNSSDKSDKADKNTTRDSESDSQRSIKVTRATHDLTTEQFIAVIGEQARQIGQDKGIYASVMIAQAILESGSGSSLLSSAPFYNLFGIKGTYDGSGVEMKTKEDDGTGNYYTITATFRDYENYSESLQDYARLLTEENPDFYAGALKANAETPYDAAKFLQGRYATSTSYAESLVAIIDTYELARYDEPLPYEPDEDYLIDVLGDSGEIVSHKRTIADLLAVATSYLGRDYVWGGNSPETGFDCSGLVQYSYNEALGIALPRTTYVQCKTGVEVGLDELHPGDLLFFDRDGDVHHVGMYLGNGFFIHAPQTGDVIKVTALEDYPPSFAIREIPTHERGKEAVPAEEKSTVVKDAASDITGMLDTVMRGMGSTIADNVAVLIENE